MRQEDLRHAPERGIGLVEVLVTVVVLSIMFAVMPASLSSMLQRSERELQKAAAERIADGAMATAHVESVENLADRKITPVEVTFTEEEREWRVTYGTEWRVESELIGAQEFHRITVRVFWPATDPQNPVGQVLRSTMRAD